MSKTFSETNPAPALPAVTEFPEGEYRGDGEGEVRYLILVTGLNRFG
jgi:hypothetical protein